MTEAEIVQELHAVLHDRLFKSPTWLADEDPVVMAAVHNKFVGLGLVTEPDANGRWSSTALGVELNYILMFVLCGCWEQADILIILLEYGLLTDAEVDNINDFICETDESLESILRPVVARAFRKFFKPRLVTN